MKHILYLLLLLSISCKSAKDINLNEVPKTETFIEYFENGKVKTVGNTIVLSDVDNYTKKVSKIKNFFINN
jgi:hypothetical protein